MEFQRFSSEVSKIKNLELPGFRSHNKMAPLQRIAELEKLKPADRDPMLAGVMALFYPGKFEETRFLLILRNTYPGVHSDQIGLPGGKLEPGDRDLLHTALRETEEEVGVSARHIRVIRELSQLYIPPSNFQVQPYLGIAEESVSFIPDPAEVQALIEVPLDSFLDDGVLGQKNMKTSYADLIEVPVYDLEGYTVWGATAMILSEIRELLSRVL